MDTCYFKLRNPDVPSFEIEVTVAITPVELQARCTSSWHMAFSAMYLYSRTAQSCAFKLHRRTQWDVVSAPVKFERTTLSDSRIKAHGRFAF